MSENASRDALSGRIGLFGRAIRPARSTTRGSEAEIAWNVAFGCFSLTGGKPNGECRVRERNLPLRCQSRISSLKSVTHGYDQSSEIVKSELDWLTLLSSVITMKAILGVVNYGLAGSGNDRS